MAQTILTVIAEVQPAAADSLRQLLAALTARQEARPQPGDQAYDALRDAVPMLHFMSITVAAGDPYDPVLVIEANFDGPTGPFWSRLESAIGADLRAMLRLCKRPRDARAALFDAVTGAGSSAPLAPLLQAMTVWPAVQHQGNRGLTRERIQAEGDLFAALQTRIDSQATLHTQSPAQIHQQLRVALLPRFGWLASPAPARISTFEKLADVARALGFLGALLLGFWLVGWVLVQLFHLLGGQAPQPGQPSPLGVLFAVAGPVLLGLIAAGVPALLRLRWLEQRDAESEGLQPDEKALRAMARQEDFITQNHMISIVHVKPGVLRMVLARLALRALGLALRITAHSGYLRSMRTIHFAHWAFLDNGGRLMFHSNFDGSWESYLDDFIEKAHAGLTLAWTHGIGFPPTRLLTGGGATEGRKFKAWARHSMSHSGFWFSAYKLYSVNQIERHARLADGLRKPTLSDPEASAWAIDL